VPSSLSCNKSSETSPKIPMYRLLGSQVRHAQRMQGDTSTRLQRPEPATKAPQRDKKVRAKQVHPAAAFDPLGELQLSTLEAFHSPK
jgi:hypothetical protein